MTSVLSAGNATLRRMTGTPDSGGTATVPRRPPFTELSRRLAALRGPDVPPRPWDARALAALAANPGCHRRALLDGAGVDKRALATRLGAAPAFGQSQFAFARGHAFEHRVKGDGAVELARLVHDRTPDSEDPTPGPENVRMPDLTADGPDARAARTRLALADAVRRGGWTVLDHPLLPLDVAGSPAHLEPDAVAVHPDGRCTVVEIKSFPILDGSAEPAKVGAAARQAAVYALALQHTADELGELRRDAGDPACARVRSTFLLVCPKDFSNLPAAEAVDLRKQLASTRRQLERLTRLEEIAARLPEGTSFHPDRDVEELTEALAAVPAAYSPDCLATCELAFHCRAGARAAGAVTALGRAVRGELGGLTTVAEALAAAHGTAPDTAPGGRGEAAAPTGAQDGDARRGVDDPAVTALRRAARLRAQALAEAGSCR